MNNQATLASAAAFFVLYTPAYLLSLVVTGGIIRRLGLQQNGVAIAACTLCLIVVEVFVLALCSGFKDSPAAQRMVLGCSTGASTAAVFAYLSGRSPNNRGR